MRLESQRSKKSGHYEKFIIDYKVENEKCISAFTYIDSEISYSYTSRAFIHDSEWEAVKIATIYAEKYFMDNRIKDGDCFFQDIWEAFFNSRKSIGEIRNGRK